MDSTKGMGRPGPKGWLGIGLRLLVTLFFLFLLLALNRCSLSTYSTGQTTVTLPATEAATARLRVDVEPRGAQVLVDGLRSGTVPVSLELPAGQHEVRVELDGYEPMEQRVDLVAGVEAIVSGELLPLPSVTAKASKMASGPAEEVPRPLPDLTIQSITIELETGGACDYASTQLGVRVTVHNTGSAGAGPFVVDVDGTQQAVAAGLAADQRASLWFEGYNPGGEHTVVVDAAAQVDEDDEGNNRFSQMLPIPTLPPTCTPPPTGRPVSSPTPEPRPTRTAASTPSSGAAVAVREGEVILPTYPYAAFTTQAWSEAFNMPYAVLDWAAYDASSPSPRLQAYRSLVLENEYLKLTFLPELGGRLYEVLYKPTGHLETYRNPVLKPSPWGPPEQRWWVAAGGFEWCLPVEEHGYEWGVPWTAQVDQDGTGATVTLRDTLAGDRVRSQIAVRLEAGAGYFTIRPRLENPTGAPLAVKYWTNAMLAPGGRNAPSAALRFVLPEAVTAVTVHSRGDESLPRPGERLPWPVFEGVDLSRLGNWNRWLGFFEDPAAGEFVAVYDEEYDEGMVRAFPEIADRVPGVKGFGFGWREPIPASTWTDDASSYVEIHGGPASTFEESVSLPAGEHLQWTEIWYPVAGLGRLRHANETAALNLGVSNGKAQISVAVTRPWSGDLVLLFDTQERWRKAVSLAPGQPFRGTASLGEDVPQMARLALRLENAGGVMVAEFSADFELN